MGYVYVLTYNRTYYSERTNIDTTQVVDVFTELEDAKACAESDMEERTASHPSSIYRQLWQSAEPAKWVSVKRNGKPALIYERHVDDDAQDITVGYVIERFAPR